MQEKTYFTIGKPIYLFELANKSWISTFFNPDFIPSEACSIKMALRKHITNEEFVSASRVGRASLFETEEDARRYAQSRRIYHRQCFDDYSEPAVYETRFFYSDNEELPEFKIVEISSSNENNPLSKLGKCAIRMAELEDYKLTYVGGNLKIVTADGKVEKVFEADGGELLVRNHPKSCLVM